MEKRPNFNRTIKVTLQSPDDRNELLKNTKKLKNAPPNMKKVYIKKDEHPVFYAENQRLKNKMYDMKNSEDYEGVDIKLNNNKLLMDEIVAAKNYLFG